MTSLLAFVCRHAEDAPAHDDLLPVQRSCLDIGAFHLDLFGDGVLPGVGYPSFSGLFGLGDDFGTEVFTFCPLELAEESMRRSIQS